MLNLREIVGALFVCMAVTSGENAAAQSQTRTSSPAIAVGVHVYRPDGQSTSTWHLYKGANQAPDHFEIYTTKSMCIFSSSYSTGKEPTDAGYGWSFDITPVKDSRSASGTVVARIDWARSMERGQKAQSPKGSVVVELVPGRHVPLDYIVAGPAEPSSPCDAVGALLDVSLRSDLRR